jgi:hypothetical protein
VPEQHARRTPPRPHLLRQARARSPRRCRRLWSTTRAEWLW